MGAGQALGPEAVANGMEPVVAAPGGATTYSEAGEAEQYLQRLSAEGREIRQEPNGYKPPLDVAVASNVTWTPKRQARMGGESNMTNDGGYGLSFTPGA